MIILVKINQSYANGINPRQCAYRAWVMGSLLDNANERNKYKYLVAYAQNKVIETYCIKGVALDYPQKSIHRKVKFLLEYTSLECDQALKDIIYNLTLSGFEKIRNAQSYCKIDVKHLKEFEIKYEKLKCPCSLEYIPVLTTEEVNYENGEKVNLHGKSRAGNKYWLKLIYKRSNFESFRDPHVINEHASVLLHPDGRLDFASSKKNALNSNNKQRVISILQLFSTNPNGALQALDNSKFASHITHLNNLTVEYIAYEDANMTKISRHEVWTKNVMIIESGFLSEIQDIMLG